jgi:hypothetical protein
MLTAKAEIADRVEGLDGGATDYDQAVRVRELVAGSCPPQAGPGDVDRADREASR